MTHGFEDHCWKDVIPPDLPESHACYQGKVFVIPNLVLLAIDLCEAVYRGTKASKAG